MLANIALISFVAFINGTLASGLIPVLNVVLERHASTAFALYFVGNLLGLLLVYFSSRLRHLPRGKMWYELLFASSFVVMSCLPNILGLHVGRFIEGVAGGLFLPLALGYVCAKSPREKVAQSVAALNIAFALGFLAGPALVEWGMDYLAVPQLLLLLAVPPVLVLPFLAMLKTDLPDMARDPALQALRTESLSAWWDKFYTLFFSKMVYGFLLAFLTGYIGELAPNLTFRMVSVCIIGIFILGQVLGSVFKRTVMSHLVQNNLLLVVAAFALYFCFVKLTLTSFLVFFFLHSIVVFVAYGKIAMVPDSTRSFALYNALTDPGLVLGSLLSGLGASGFWGLVIAGILPAFVFLVTPASRFRAEAELPPFGLFALLKILKKQKILCRQVEPTLERKGLVFEYQNPTIEPHSNTIKLAFSGDFGPLAKPVDLSPEVKAVLQTCDLRFLNLEGPCIDKTLPAWKAKLNIFNITSEQVRRLHGPDAYNVFNVVNNHILDNGAAGLDETLSHLKSQDIPAITSQGGVLTSKGIRVGHIALTFEANAFIFRHELVIRLRPQDFIDKTAHALAFLERIKALKQESDLVVLSYHWGFESEFAPSSVQQACAKILFAAGVDVIYGQHPHIVHPFEVSGQKLSLYSCGNLAMMDTMPLYHQGVIFVAEYAQGPQGLVLQRVDTHFTQYDHDVIRLFEPAQSQSYQFWRENLYVG